MKDSAKKKLHTSRLQALLAVGALVAGLGLVTPSADATPVMTASVGGAPGAASQYESFNTVPLGSGAYLTPTGITVSFTPDAQAVVGASGGKYAAPFLSGNNGLNFGGQADGQDTTTFLSSGSAGNVPGAGVRLTLPGQETYLGLLWGSVDPYNTLTFYDGTALLAAFTGADVDALANGSQGAGGTLYVNFYFSTPFTSVVATSSQYAFEFDNVAFSAHSIDTAHTIGVPEPGTAGIFLLGLLTLGSGYWLKRREQRLA